MEHPCLILVDEHVIVRRRLEKINRLLCSPEVIVTFFHGVRRLETDSSTRLLLEGGPPLALEVKDEKWMPEVGALSVEVVCDAERLTGCLTTRGVLEGTELWIHIECSSTSKARLVARRLQEVARMGLIYLSSEFGS